MVRIIQYRDKCIGCASCVESDNSRWRISYKDGKSILIGGIEKHGIFSTLANPVELEELLEAERNCPAGIIRIESFRKNNPFG